MFKEFWQFIRRIICRIICRRKKAAPLPVPKRLENWRAAAGVDVGDNHRRQDPPVPCQDAAIASAGGGLRPCAFVADGAGSAALSHFGSTETTLRLSHLVAALEDINIQLLDSPVEPTPEECRKHAKRFIAHAVASVSHLAKTKQEPFKKFHCTLLMVIVGANRALWAKVGDGQIVREVNKTALQILGVAGKGEFANQTSFIRESAEATEFDSGIISTADVSGFALMTDGAAEKLVAHDGTKVAGAVSRFLANMREGKWQDAEVCKMLANKDIWKRPGYTGDDKGLALLARLDGARTEDGE